MLSRHWAERMMDMCWEVAKEKSREGGPWILTGTHTPQGPASSPFPARSPSSEPLCLFYLPRTCGC